MEESYKVHLQLATMLKELQRSKAPQPWFQQWQVASQQTQQPPAPSSASSTSLPVKAAPSSNTEFQHGWCFKEPSVSSWARR